MGGERLAAIEWFPLIVELVAAAGIGSPLTQFVSRSGERRALRTKVREELSTLEWLRWAVADEAEMQRRSAELLSARRRLLSAAMLANVPRKLVEEYGRLALAARESSRKSP